MTIEGLKITISSTELVKHFRQKADYHGEKASWYQAQTSSLETGMADLREQMGASNDPINSLQSSARQHAAKAAYFAFLADHVVPNEEYLLTERELEAIEIFSRYF